MFCIQLYFVYHFCPLVQVVYGVDSGFSSFYFSPFNSVYDIFHDVAFYM